MNAREYSAAFEGELRTHGFERRCANDARPQGLTVQPLHKKALAQAIGLFEHVEDFRLRHADRTGHLHQPRLHRQPRMNAGRLRLGRQPTRRPAHGQQALASACLGADAVGFLAGTAGQSLDGNQPIAARQAVGDDGVKPLIEFGIDHGAWVRSTWWRASVPQKANVRP